MKRKKLIALGLAAGLSVSGSIIASAEQTAQSTEIIRW